MFLCTRGTQILQRRLTVLLLNFRLFTLVSKFFVSKNVPLKLWKTVLIRPSKVSDSRVRKQLEKIFSENLLLNVPTTSGKHLCSPAEKLFFKSMRNFFPKHISTDVKCTFDNIVRTLSNQFLEERYFSRKCSSAHLECFFDNTGRQIRGHSSSRKFEDLRKFFL